ncbi:MAG TPA: tetratricopeptide repeat protein [Gemmataceae bacterium]|nr:tetratricopeptide repeat protein [Gemmataceae bacterium]
MKYAPWGALLAILVMAANARAQFPLGRGVGFGYANRNYIIGAYLGPRFGYGYYPGYYYPTYYYPYYPIMPSTVVVVQPVVALAPLALPNFPVVPPLNERDDPLVIQPKKPPNKQAVQQAPPAPKNPPPPKIPAPQPQPVLAPVPEMDKKAEADRLVKLGKEAFADEEHGRAAERFVQASRVQPDSAEALFLLAQAQFALGKYREAVASIYAGMKLQPEWPSSKFDLRGLYANNPAELIEQLNSLRQAAEANPQEPALLFLYGYQLWFLGRQDEAKKFFEKARPMVTDAKPIDQFLQAP